ncbi:hypothetical protein FRC16_004194 [Serendipita sp. 398]|nr:hypothetical protein FRC16_004194 [Serendipita sp. 398]
MSRASLWRSTLLIPVYLGVLSAIVALFHVLILVTPLKRLFFRRNISRTPVIHEDREAGLLNEVKANIKSNGGIVIWSYKLARLLGSIALFGVATTAAIIACDDNFQANGKHWGKKHRGRHGRHRHRFSDYEWLQIALAAFYMYTSFLALCTLILSKRAKRPAKNHLNILFSSALFVYLYRDVWPLATFTLHPVDPHHWTTWTSIALLVLVAVIVPIFMPHEYVPIDPSNPSKDVNPEQTASWFTFFCFTFLDPIVFEASRTDHLPYEALPPLADYDAGDHLRKTSFPLIDPLVLGRRRHLFWGLMTYFYKEFIALAFLIFLKVVVGFAGPLGINRLLTYIENGGRDAVVRPWVWISWLFIGPLVGSAAMQWYIFINTRTLVRIEAILTQLVFEHSLRIRMKEEVPASEKPTGGTTVVPTPESEPGEPEPGNGHQTDGITTAGGTSQGESSSRRAASKGKDKPKKETSVAPSVASSTAGTSTKKAENLVGKINNFVSTDLGNITEARDFLFMVWYTPLQIAICVWFLYSILGVASILGMGVLIASIPVPSLIGALLQKVNKERMERTDSRVQAITEYINVLRMIKLFAWEGRVQQKMSEKREEELRWTKKRQFLQLLNMNTNYLLPLLVMIVTFASYTLVFKHELTASRVFSSIAVFDMLRDQLHIVLWGVNAVIQGKVSLDRLTDFLNNTELLDSFSDAKKDTQIHITAPADPNAIGFRNATFAWAESLSGTPTPGRRNFRLKIEGELYFTQGGVNMIVGPTGAGKTSILMALLGEMHFQPAGPDAFFNLPRSGGVSFCSQEPWITNQTIRDNILFGSPYEEERYKKGTCSSRRKHSLIVSQCSINAP